MSHIIVSLVFAHNSLTIPISLKIVIFFGMYVFSKKFLGKGCLGTIATEYCKLHNNYHIS